MTGCPVVSCPIRFDNAKVVMHDGLLISVKNERTWEVFHFYGNNPAEGTQDHDRRRNRNR